MISCKIDQKNFGGSLFCDVCGMDLGFKPIKKSHKGMVDLYCCKDCAKL